MPLASPEVKQINTEKAIVKSDSGVNQPKLLAKKISEVESPLSPIALE